MDKALFVQNIKHYCDLVPVKPTVACRESGAGKDLINQIERQGSMPAIDRVQLLAQYLGVTVNDLLGDTKPPSDLPKETNLTEAEQELVAAYRAADDHARSIVDLTLEPYRTDRQREADVG